MRFDDLVWPGRRQPVFATNGMVATSQPLAAQVGLDVLRDGGNAVDAAVATAVAATVVEAPTSSMGGDVFALVWDGGRLHALNGSGGAPLGLSPDLVTKLGHESMPEHGWLPVTVPGAPAAWHDLHARFGRLPFARLVEPAADYAERGHPASPISVWHWRWQVDEVHPTLSGDEFAHFHDLYAPGGTAPGVGETWRSADMAGTLRLIGETGAETVYRGEIAQRIVEFAQVTGGYLAAEDLESHASQWVDPISTSYRGYEVWEAPPSSQGIAALIALNILEGFEVAQSERNSAAAFHLQIEAIKLACTDVQRYVGDPDRVAVPTVELLSKEYATRRRAQIGEHALEPLAGEPHRGDTVYLCTADRDGMMVSLIQSSNDAFGSHVVVPGTGIALQNRGAGFTLEPGHPNVLAPGKRPFNTIIPAFLTRDGGPVGPFGVMGGPMQPQGHVQVVVNTVDYAMDPQTCLDQPRFHWRYGRRLLVEPAVEAEIREGLAARGHEVHAWDELDAYGRGSIIWRLPDSAYVGGADHRGDGQAVGY